MRKYATSDVMDWDKVRIAAEVVRAGTISEAAETLGLHRATVTRHIDSLEEAFGNKLFLRHARGLTPTDLGLDLLRVADATHDQFGQLQRRAALQSGGLTGELVITTIHELVTELFPAIHLFAAQHPNVIVRIISRADVLRLEYGEAHIAIRGGKRPDHPDNVVQHFRQLRMGLYAAMPYIDRHGAPASPDDYGHHSFIGPASSEPRAPFLGWMINNIPTASMNVRSDQGPVMIDAIKSGLGIGFLPQSIALSDGNLVEIAAPHDDWAVETWIVTHVDLHRTPKVQAFLAAMKATIWK